MEAACSERALMCFPASFPSRGRDLLGIKRKKKRRRGIIILGRRKNLIYLPDSKNLPGLPEYYHSLGGKSKMTKEKKGGKLTRLPPLDPYNPAIQTVGGFPYKFRAAFSA
jgi:hypothetical protein